MQSNKTVTFAWLLVLVVRLLVDVEVLLRVDICESSTGEYIEYSASPNLGCSEVGGGGLFGGDGFRRVEVDIVTKLL
jgi:hypothetical protein